uniref:Uncharacterized protein n=1 Tax=Anopheles minimus TaxID=112268 RepID=A0A182W1N5_9DIPT
MGISASQSVWRNHDAQYPGGPMMLGRLASVELAAFGAKRFRLLGQPAPCAVREALFVRKRSTQIKQTDEVLCSYMCVTFSRPIM